MQSYEVVTIVLLMIQVFWGVTLCPLVYIYSSFYGITEHSSFTAWKARPMLGHSMTAAVLTTVTEQT
jgi:hypothetical protein